MKAISIKNPYATQIMQGSMTIEYRSWDTKYRGDLLICSSANPIIPGMLSGHALCIVNLANTAYDSTEDMYAWHLVNVRKIKAFGTLMIWLSLMNHTTSETEASLIQKMKGRTIAMQLCSSKLFVGALKQRY